MAISELQRRVWEQGYTGEATGWMPLRSDSRPDGMKRMCEMAHGNLGLLDEFAGTDWLRILTLYEIEPSVQKYTGELVGQDLRFRLWQLCDELDGLGYEDIDTIPDLDRTKKGICVLGKTFGAVSAQVEFDKERLLSSETTRWNVDRAIICTRHLSTLGQDEGKYIFEVVESAKSWYWMVSYNPVDRDFYHNPQDREGEMLYKSELMPVAEDAYRKRNGYVRSKIQK